MSTHPYCQELAAEEAEAERADIREIGQRR